MSTIEQPDTVPDKGVLEPDRPRLNIGGGRTPIPGYLTVDRVFGDEAYPLEFGDDTLDEIYASHVLEHFGWSEYEDVLRDWIRAIRPGGTLRISVPDIDRAMAMAGQPGMPPVGAVLMGGQTDPNDFHKSAWNTPDLTALLKRLGLVNVREFEPFANDCSRWPFSANVEGTKPTESMKRAPYQQVTFLMSVPRLGFTLQMQKLTEAIYKFNAPCVMEGGAYFGISMERGIKKALAYDTPYIIAIDYDTVFEDSDIWKLVTLMETRPEYDIIAATQLRRGEHRVLVSGSEGSNYSLADFADEVIPVRTSCFGLTIFRREVFEKLPYPWLRHREEYNEDGTHARTVEADMVFWEKCEAAGVRLGLATGVCIGHLEEFVVWPGPDYRPVYQEESDYRHNGKPKGAHP